MGYGGRWRRVRFRPRLPFSGTQGVKIEYDPVARATNSPPERISDARWAIVLPR